MTLRHFLYLLLASSAAAQTPAALPDDLKPYTAPIRAAQTASAADRKTRVDNLILIEDNLRAFLEYAALQPAAQRAAAMATLGHLSQQLADARIDQPEGAGSNASGSVSSVTEAGITSLISLAVDMGAITQTISGTTATVSGNVDGVARFVLGREPFPYCEPAQLSCGTPVLKDLAFAASFDLSRGDNKNFFNGKQAFDLETAKRDFSNGMVKYVFANPQDVRSKAFRKLWNDFYIANRAQFQNAGVALLRSLGPAVEPVLKSPAYDALTTGYEKKLLDTLGAGGDIVPVFREYLNGVVALARTVSPDFDLQVQAAVSGYMRFFASTRPLIASIVTKPVFSAEYDYQRPASQPDLHHFAVMSTLSPLGPTGSLTINVAGSAFANGTDVRTYGRWRDFQASLQLERKLGDMINHPATFSVAGYYQYMLTPGLLKIDEGDLAPGTSINLGQTASIALAPKGSIWIAEAKLTIKLRGSGAEIPFAITRASRTDLIDAPVIRGHIGLNFDFGRLFAK